MLEVVSSIFFMTYNNFSLCISYFGLDRMCAAMTASSSVGITLTSTRLSRVLMIVSCYLLDAESHFTPSQTAYLVSS